MGVTPARDPGPGKTDGGVGKVIKDKPMKGKATSLVPPGKAAAPQECVGSRTRDRAKRGPGLVKKIEDPPIFNESSGKSVLPARAAREQEAKKGVLHARVAREQEGKHTKSRSLLHLTSKG